MSPWLALALAIIVAGGFAILRAAPPARDRGHLLGHLRGVGIAVLAASGHAMTARWHLGPVSDWYFWRVLAFSPEILVFLFFMITDPKTIPAGKTGRRRLRRRDRAARGAPDRAADDRVRHEGRRARALALVCAARPVLELLPAARSPRRVAGRAAGAAARRGRRGFAGLLVVAGIPARSNASATILAGRSRPAPGGDRRCRRRGSRRVDRRTARADRARRRRRPRERGRRAPPPRPRRAPRPGADGARLAALWQQIDAGGRPIDVPRYSLERDPRHARAGRRPGAADRGRPASTGHAPSVGARRRGRFTRDASSSCSRTAAT